MIANLFHCRFCDRRRSIRQGLLAELRVYIYEIILDFNHLILISLLVFKKLKVAYSSLVSFLGDKNPPILKFYFLLNLVKQIKIQEKNVSKFISSNLYFIPYNHLN